MATKKRVHKKKSTGKKRRRGIRGVNPPVISGVRKNKRRRAKKMGEITGSTAGDALLGTAVGAIGTAIVNKYIPVNDKAKALVETAVGLGTVYYGVKKKKPFVAGVGAGMAIVGGLGVGKSFGLIEGMDDIMAGIGFTEVMEGVGQGKEDTMVIEIQGTGDLENQNFLNGNNPPVVSGGNEINSPYDGMNGQPPVIS